MPQVRLHQWIAHSWAFLKTPLELAYKHVSALSQRAYPTLSAKMGTAAGASPALGCRQKCLSLTDMTC